jgi:acyl-coenzyme A thioesterase PaaI-like protein
MTNNNALTQLQKLWQRLHKLPGGRWLFSRILGWVVPYSGSIRATVINIKPGYAQLQLRDRRRVRNHLNSIHAIALTNLGEYTSGLAMLGTLSTTTRGIPTKISIEFYKKARGNIMAESHCTPPNNITEDTDFEVFTDLKDSEGDVVARTTVNWRLGPVPEQIKR